jgi:hypothetical protein
MFILSLPVILLRINPAKAVDINARVVPTCQAGYFISVRYRFLPKNETLFSHFMRLDA